MDYEGAKLIKISRPQELKSGLCDFAQVVPFSCPFEVRLWLCCVWFSSAISPESLDRVQNAALANIGLLCTFITCQLTVCYVSFKFLDSTSRYRNRFYYYYFNTIYL